MDDNQSDCEDQTQTLVEVETVVVVGRNDILAGLRNMEVFEDQSCRG